MKNKIIWPLLVVLIIILIYDSFRFPTEKEAFNCANSRFSHYQERLMEKGFDRNKFSAPIVEKRIRRNFSEPVYVFYWNYESEDQNNGKAASVAVSRGCDAEFFYPV